MRKIIVAGKEYQWKVGRSCVVIRDPETNKSKTVTLSELTGRSPDIIERGQWKKTSDGMVSPKHISIYIQKNGGIK